MSVLNGQTVCSRPAYSSIKADLKAKKAELKTVEKELGKLEEQKAAFDAAQAEEAKKAEQEESTSAVDG